MAETEAEYWQRVLRNHFPDVIVGRFWLDDPDDIFYNVYCVPDDRTFEFFKFYLDGGPRQYLRPGEIDPPILSGISCSNTRDHHSKIWQMHLDEVAKRRTGKSKITRKTASRRQSAPAAAVRKSPASR